MVCISLIFGAAAGQSAAVGAAAAQGVQQQHRQYAGAAAEVGLSLIHI